MITSINDYRQVYLNSKVNENTTIPSTQSIQANAHPIQDVDVDTQNNINKIVDYAKSLELSKPDTLSIVSKVFIDPAQAPEDISVAFVQDHLEEILTKINNTDDSEFAPIGFQFPDEVANNTLPFECAMYIPANDKIKKLTEALNVQIKKENFKAIYENGIFFINSLEKLNESNKTIVLDILKECNAKNISNSLKWKRKIV